MPRITGLPAPAAKPLLVTPGTLRERIGDGVAARAQQLVAIDTAGNRGEAIRITDG